MNQTKKATKELIEDMLSKDAQRIWSASCTIISLGQNHDRIMELVPYLAQMKSKTNNIKLGGVIHPNSRFLKKAFKVIEWHASGVGCSCSLLGEESNPIQLEENGYITIIDTVYMNNSNFIDYYLAICHSCKAKYKIQEREYHSIWWDWIKLG